MRSPAKATVRFAFVGDVLWRDPLPETEAVAAALDLIGRADVAFGNLEGPASARGTAAPKPIRLRMDPGRLDDLARAGFRVVSVANNHILDYGIEAFLDTLEQLARRQIAAVGGAVNLQAARQPAVLTVDGVKVAFLAAASTLPPGFAAGDDRPGIAPIHVSETFQVDPGISLEQPGTSPFVHTRAWGPDIESAQAAVRQARQSADLVIFSIHWGVPAFWRAPFQGELAEYQQPLGRALIDAGADLVVGHHPHSLHGIETYRGKPIVYSLGNFIFHMPASIERSPLLLRLPHHMEGLRDESWTASMIFVLQLGPAGTAAYEVWPLALDRAGNPSLLEGNEARTLIERIAVLSAPLGARVVFAEGRGRLVL